MRDVDGVIVGFWHPQYLEGINVAGYHCHFLTADHRAGGHLLDCRIKQAKVELSQMNAIRFAPAGPRGLFPNRPGRRSEAAIDQVER